jgi:hypothetical protein
MAYRVFFGAGPGDIIFKDEAAGGGGWGWEAVLMWLDHGQAEFVARRPGSGPTRSDLSPASRKRRVLVP